MNVLAPFVRIAEDIADRIETNYLARKWDRNRKRANATVRELIKRQQ